MSAIYLKEYDMSSNSISNPPKPIVSPNEIPYSWIRNELVFEKYLQKGARGKKVKIIQEWLSFNNFHLAIDGLYGPATEQAVKMYQSKNELESSGIVDQSTFDSLVKPMLRALTPLEEPGNDFGNKMINYAHQHLLEHPREIGGQNRGPWVRLYMSGNEGRQWCLPGNKRRRHKGKTAKSNRPLLHLL